MIHGWGMNSAVFTPLHSSLSQYRVHYVDLPGFGNSTAIDGEIDNWLEALIKVLPESAIWVGWSLGGLVATLAATQYPQKIKGLITIASSPCFMAREEEKWPGIPPQVLAQFGQSLHKDLSKTVERFLAIQAMGSATAKEDIKQLRSLVLAKPLPNSNALLQGLKMLEEVDLRPKLNQIEMPWLRIWGRLDSLVPRHVPALMPKNVELYQDVILNKASHAPFISHTDEFLDEFVTWIEKVTN
ncbi:pimeloyl-ACP methyl ester esterase BioH [Shewanella eurypsychrophilus]|uniref:Pimeloyl-[acyl-carrier protein] methyl ester esterase n=2 Tax=Shewanellaceae TaxID=267890 RepID=A0ABX6VEL6_9GAMM|nr:pimeloyl-ACP methyl ester esterase BioH [Shewanella sp. YLB-09]QFU25141.1 pimeloyl-ACP methyl ester esterase BioH [Shewanella sp. YLB-09]QPG60291.1 pimeloyl-ACP methyl ester esterase BioH [Shewanella eurypsychrophilus]